LSAGDRASATGEIDRTTHHHHPRMWETTPLPSSPWCS